jgi:hypothetical protein
MMTIMLRSVSTLLLVGCTSSEPCTPDQIARLEAACLAEIARICADAPPPSGEGEAESAIVAVCPAAAAVFDKCEVERQKWVRCDG